MQWNNHSRLVNAHAFLGASKYQWLNYDEEKLKQVYLNAMAVQRGTELHAFAAKAIKLGVTLPEEPKTTLGMHVNDAIRFDMDPEVVLYFSDNCFGTADAICFRNDTLRIHDLKTGITPAHIEQLKIYAALFCLEYSVYPNDICTVLRIYQNVDVKEEIANPSDIYDIMTKIRDYDHLINILKKGV